LNQAILDYLNSSGFEDSFEAFRKEANVDIDPKKMVCLKRSGHPFYGCKKRLWN
jgi:hypothetical protein